MKNAPARRRIVKALVLLGTTTVTLVLLSPGVAEEKFPVELLKKANAAFAERFVGEKMEKTISYYEASLPYLKLLSVQSQAFVLDRLSQCYYELTTFSKGNTLEDRTLFEKGKAYGMRSLQLNPGFFNWKDQDFTKALSYVEDQAALLWTANNWGALFGFDPVEGMMNIGKVKAMYERGIELAEDYWGASFHNALGALLVTTPPFLGGDPEQGELHLKRALELSLDYLENHVVYAQYWGFTYDLFGKTNGIRDRKLIKQELGFVLAAPIGEWPFWNREAKKEAEILLQKLQELTDAH